MNMAEILLFDYWRSSASYRVRIALNLKGAAYQSVPTSLIDGDHKTPDYTARNSQGFVPTLSIDGHNLTQSLAIIDYLDARFPAPCLIPKDPLARARALSAAYIVAADIHPVNNLRILKYLKDILGHGQDELDDWYRRWIIEGFTALEAVAPQGGLFGGDSPNIADICLVPQMANARRFETPLAAFPKLARIDAELNRLGAFATAAPEAVKPE